MSLSEDIQKFKEKALQQHNQLAQERAKEWLREQFPEEYEKIRSFSFDSKETKFFDVDAPEEILNQLREAGLLKAAIVIEK